VPGYFIMLWGVTRLFGNSELVLRLPSALAGAAAVVGVWAIGRALKRETAAILAAVLMALSPLAVFWSQQVKPEALAVTIAVWSSFLLLAAWRRGGTRWWVAYSLLNVVGLYVFYFHFFVLAAHSVVILAWHARRREWAAALRWLALQCLVCATLAPWLVLALTRGLFGEVAKSHAQMPLSLGQYALESAYGLLAGQPYGGPLGAAVLVLMATLIAVALLRLRRNALTFELSVLGAWLVVPLAALYVLQLIVPTYETRYLLMVIPAFCLVLGISLEELLKSRTLLRLAAVVSTCFVVVFWLRMDIQFYETPLYAHGFREAATYFVNHREDNGIILGLRGEYEMYAYDYYLREPGHYVTTSLPTISDQLRTLKDAGYRGIWLTSYTVGQRLDIEDPLEAVASSTEQLTDHNVRLRYYRFADTVARTAGVATR